MRGIYLIKNLNSGKEFVGMAEDIEKTMSQVQSRLRYGRHTAKDMQDDYNNGDEFDYEIVQEIPEGNMKDIRRSYIRLRKSDINGYNKPTAVNIASEHGIYDSTRKYEEVNLAILTSTMTKLRKEAAAENVTVDVIINRMLI